jgi:hypothetical protein
VYCPNAYAGLAVCAGLYHPSQYNYITYEDASGGLNNADAQARIAYYGISGFPTLKFDGYTTVVGAGPDAATGAAYSAIIQNHRLTTTPVAVAVTGWSFDAGSAFADVKVKLFGNLASAANTRVRVALVENHLSYGGHSHYNRVLRDMFPDAVGTALTIQNTGEEQLLHLPFTWDAGWNPAECLIIAWVQRDSDKFIYNSSNSSVGEFAVMAAVDGAQQAIAQPGNPIVFGQTNIMNVGTEADTYDLTLDTSNLPAGWDAHFTFNGVDGTSATTTLDPFTSTSLVVTMNPGVTGSGFARLTVFSQGGGEVVATLDFAGLAGGTDVLVIADDGAQNYAYDYFGPALTSTGRSFAVWDRDLSTVTGATLVGYDAVIWLCGGSNPGLIPADRTAIDGYLASGGHLLLTGQDIAQDLQDEGGAARVWFQLKTRCRYLPSGISTMSINGVAGDPISDGMSFQIAGGDGANNQTDPDAIDVLTADAIPVFRYDSGSLVGSRVEVDGYRLVFLGFGFEGIADGSTRDNVMTSILTWLIGGASTPVQDTPPALALAPNTPNPFNPATKIAFALDRAGPVQLAVYDLQGRRIRTLIDEPLAAGPHDLMWDGRDDAGHQAASGTYVYRLTTNGSTLSHKMTLVK